MHGGKRLKQSGISTMDLSLARTTPMVFELQFDLDVEKNAAILALARNGLEFHLSPERYEEPEGPSVVLEPSTAILGLIESVLMFRRKRG